MLEITQVSELVHDYCAESVPCIHAHMYPREPLLVLLLPDLNCAVVLMVMAATMTPDVGPFCSPIATASTSNVCPGNLSLSLENLGESLVNSITVNLGV